MERKKKKERERKKKKDLCFFLRATVCKLHATEVIVTFALLPYHNGSNDDIEDDVIRQRSSGSRRFVQEKDRCKKESCGHL